MRGKGAAKKRASAKNVPEGDAQTVRRMTAQAYGDQYIAKATAAWGDFLAIKTEPERRLLKFFEAIQDGMPEVESAFYFLDLDPEEFAALLESNDSVRWMIQLFKGHIAREQYRKVIRADGYAAAIRWLEQNRPEAWVPKSKVELGGKDGGPLTIQVVYADTDNPTPETPWATGSDQESSEEV